MHRSATLHGHLQTSRIPVPIEVSPVLTSWDPPQFKALPFKVMQKDNHVDFGMLMCISHMHPTLIIAIGLVTGDIAILC